MYLYPTIYSGALYQHISYQYRNESYQHNSTYKGKNYQVHAKRSKSVMHPEYTVTKTFFYI